MWKNKAVTIAVAVVGLLLVAATWWDCGPGTEQVEGRRAVKPFVVSGEEPAAESSPLVD